MITVKRFTAPWCAPCRALAPVLKSLETEMPDVKFEVVDIDASPDEASLNNIRSVPTVLVLRDDVVVSSLVGLNPKNKYVEAILIAQNA